MLIYVPKIKILNRSSNTSTPLASVTSLNSTTTLPPCDFCLGKVHHQPHWFSYLCNTTISRYRGMNRIPCHCLMLPFPWTFRSTLLAGFFFPMYRRMTPNIFAFFLIFHHAWLRWCQRRVPIWMHAMGETSILLFKGSIQHHYLVPC